MSSDLQRDIERIDAIFEVYGLRLHAEAWHRLRARLTPDRERVARAIQNAHGPMHPDFAFALADAAIKAMEGEP